VAQRHRPSGDPALTALPEAAAAQACAVELPERPVQLRGSALARAVLRLFGWRLLWNGLPSAQGVIVAYPHTSNWDFPLTMLARWGTGIPAQWWAKDSLFRVPLFGRFLRAIGGVPIVRNAPQGVVGQMVQEMQAARAAGRFCWLALTPEGTRSHGAGWRTGFYRVAHGAGVPVALGIIDYATRRVGIDSAWRLSGDMDADFAQFARRLAPVRGRRPDQAAPVRAAVKAAGDDAPREENRA
jgi:1-acyl-sn-glycerol-3-phosphate acyltransferase